MKNGRKCKTSFCIIDAQSIKNTDTAKVRGYDTGKKISGTKRHIAVDTNGLPHALRITTANITDRNGALEIFESNKRSLTKVKKILADGGYTGEYFTNRVKHIIQAEVKIAKRNKLHTFKILPKRWVVEKSFG